MTDTIADALNISLLLVTAILKDRYYFPNFKKKFKIRLKEVKKLGQYRIVFNYSN